MTESNLHFRPWIRCDTADIRRTCGHRVPEDKVLFKILNKGYGQIVQRGEDVVGYIITQSLGDIRQILEIDAQEGESRLEILGYLLNKAKQKGPNCCIVMQHPEDHELDDALRQNGFKAGAVYRNYKGKGVDAIMLHTGRALSDEEKNRVRDNDPHTEPTYEEKFNAALERKNDTAFSLRAIDNALVAVIPEGDSYLRTKILGHLLGI